MKTINQFLALGLVLGALSGCGEMALMPDYMPVQAMGRTQADRDEQNMALYFAVMYTNSEDVQMALDEGADINARLNNSGMTALMLSAYGGTEEDSWVIETLLENNANVYLKSPDGKTALDFAMKSKSREARTKIVSMLKKAMAAGQQLPLRF